MIVKACVPKTKREAGDRFLFDVSNWCFLSINVITNTALKVCFHVASAVKVIVKVDHCANGTVVLKDRMGPRAHSHQVKAGVKAKKIKKQAKISKIINGKNQSKFSLSPLHSFSVNTA